MRHLRSNTDVTASVWRAGALRPRERESQKKETPHAAGFPKQLSN